MGYDLHITRKSPHLDESSDITLDEWLEVIQNDPELTFDELNKRNYPYCIYWSGPGKYPCWLDYDRGEVFTKNPTDEMIDKMVQIAKLLNAVVQGDDGEEYLGDRWVADMEMTGPDQAVRRVSRLPEKTMR